ncbi:antifreeze protein [Neotabrizicola shimadae]|nr:antifreeze protein [Neotabrizicola shimadae]
MTQPPRSMLTMPLDVFRLWMQSGLMLAEAQAVIAMRLWGMAGLWNTAPGEMTRMVSEKGEAAVASARAAGRAVAQGKPATDVALAALKPVRARTKSNARRLTRRGPSGPAA